jgi:hypothetical protein
VWDGDRNERSGAQILDDLSGFLARFIAYPSEAARIAHVLWLAHTHMMEAWESTPRLAALSSEPASGKSRVLEVSELFVPRPVEAVNVTPAYLFRKVAAQEGRPTILFDEIDTVFGPKAKDNEEIRGLLNAGHRRGASAGRCVIRDKEIVTEEIPAYCAVALAGLGRLPDTILTRSVVIQMRRRAPEETIEPFRRRSAITEAEPLRDELAAWAASILPSVTDVWPKMPPGISDRDADVWEALLAVADAAGGSWPERARVSAVSLVSHAREIPPSLGIRLLADIREIFGDREQMFTDQLVSELCDRDESPWGDLKGSPLDARGLSSHLKQYEVRPAQIRIGPRTQKGYRRADFLDAWSRYLKAPPGKGETSETSETAAEAATEGRDPTLGQSESTNDG